MNTSTQPATPRRCVTFFHTDGCERQTVEPIAAEASLRGFEVKFSERLTDRAQIGVYCQHACRPNADFSVIMLHDLAQRHDIWPRFWHFEPWKDFDLGLLPGQSWAERWQAQSASPEARPRLGVFDAGWPKADLAFRDLNKFHDEAERLRQQLGLKHAKSILYAPSWENHGKQDDFVKAFMDLPVNLLLKQAPWPDSYPAIVDNIRRMNDLHRGCAENVHIVDQNVSIMYCMGLADVLVSDESSVLTEALLLDVPAVAVEDWLIPDCNPPRRSCVPFDHVIKTTRARMRTTVQDILKEPGKHLERIRVFRDRQFSWLGQSAARIMDIVEAAVEGRELPCQPIASRLDLDREEYRQAENMLEAGQLEEAVKILFALAKAETSCWEVYNDLGVLLLGEGNAEGAVLMFESAVARAREPLLPLTNLVEAYCVANVPDKALAAMAMLSKQIPVSDTGMSAIRECMVKLIEGAS